MSQMDGALLDGVRLDADVCVIGGGPAGIVVASELAELGHFVVVLEAGSQGSDIHRLRNLPRTVVGHAVGSQADTRGKNRGIPYYPLRMSRVRGIGGSTRALKSHGLRSRPLDGVDFEPIHGDGWPMPYEEFASFLSEAARYCGIPGADPSWDSWSPSVRGDQLAGFAAVGFRHGSRDTFRSHGLHAIESDRQQWILSAAATGFEVDTAGHVTGVRVVSRAGGSFTVEAQSIVLAAGGIDNARILLANEALLENMGPAADQVGRNFMEHLHYVAGHLVPNGSEARQEINNCFRIQDGQDPWLTASDSVVRSERVARTAFAAVPAYASSLDSGVSALGRVIRSAPFGPFDRSLWSGELQTVMRGAAKIPRGIGERISPPVGRDVFAVTAMSEQTPNLNSRITLSDRKDRAGLRLPILDWRMNEIDLDSARRTAELLGSYIAAADLGEFVPTWDANIGHVPAITGGWHHMGTTMMSLQASDGVVDPNCKLHGVPNVFVAGSSVFPTGGFANPTLSLVALSIRLARHLHEGLSGEQTARHVDEHVN
jgi:choline dehydrogenase-like flavoprotein